jgi:hypothetical protein
MKRLVPLLILLTSLAQAKTLHVSVVDTGLDLSDSRLNGHLCSSGHIDFTGEGITDTVGHGTSIVGLIERFAGNGDYCLVIYKYYSPSVSGSLNLTREIKALEEATKNNAPIVNLSSSGPIFDEKEYLTIKDNPLTLFMVAAGNDGKDLDIPGNESYPGSYGLNNVFIIGNVDSKYVRASTSNYGKKVSAVEIGEKVSVLVPKGYDIISGTSISTAIFTGKLIRKALDDRKSIRK